MHTCVPSLPVVRHKALRYPVPLWLPFTCVMHGGLITAYLAFVLYFASVPLHPQSLLKSYVALHSPLHLYNRMTHTWAYTCMNKMKHHVNLVSAISTCCTYTHMQERFAFGVPLVSCHHTSTHTQERFEVDAPIVRHPSVDIARAIGPGGKEASTSFSVICSNPTVELQPAEGDATTQGAPALSCFTCLMHGIKTVHVQRHICCVRTSHRVGQNCIRELYLTKDLEPLLLFILCKFTPRTHNKQQGRLHVFDQIQCA